MARFEKKKTPPPEETEEDFRRMKLPRPPQAFGIVEQRLGGSRMSVRCLDGKTRICRIPGRLKRKLWVRETNVVIAEPWEYDDSKGDIIYKYRRTQVEWLIRSGKLKDLTEMDEF